MNSTTIVMLLSNAYSPDDRVRNEALTLQDSGYKVIILAWDRECIKSSHEIVDGIEVKRLPIKAGFGQGISKVIGYFLVWFWYVKQVSLLHPEVIHCHDFDTYFAGILSKIFNRSIRLVLDTHENYYMMMKPFVPVLVSGVIQLAEKSFTRFADLVISSNEANASYYQEFGAKEIVVVGNWKNPQIFQFNQDVICQKRGELGINGQLVIAYIGGLSAERNVIPLLDAVRARPWTFLILGGNGDQEEEIRSASSRITNVFFPGYIHPDTVPLLTAISDVIYYGFDPGHIYAPYNAPNKLYEALAAGKAIIAGDLGGELTSVIKNTQCGLLLKKITPETVGGAIDCFKDEDFLLSVQERSKKAGLTSYNLSISQEVLRQAYSDLLNKTNHA